MAERPSVVSEISAVAESVEKRFLKGRRVLAFSEYLDLFAGFGGCILGHCHPELIRAGGEDVTYSYAVTNTSAAGALDPMSNIVLLDDNGTAFNFDDFAPTYISGDDNDGLLEVGETWLGGFAGKDSVGTKPLAINDEDLPPVGLAGVLLHVVGGEVETGAVGGRGENRKLRLESGGEKENCYKNKCDFLNE